MLNETIKFADERHEATFQKCREKYGFKMNSGYHVLLFYLLSSVADMDQIADICVVGDNGHTYLQTDALNQGWMTHAERKVIRLAAHLYTNDVPTLYLYEGNSARQINEIEEFLPCTLFVGGLDLRLIGIVLEALRMLMYWNVFIFECAEEPEYLPIPKTWLSELLEEEWD